MNMRHLRPADLDSSVWHRLRKELQARVEDLRDQLEVTDDMGLNSTIRGQIMECRLILSLSRHETGAPSGLPEFPADL